MTSHHNRFLQPASSQRSYNSNRTRNPQASKVIEEAAKQLVREFLAIKAPSNDEPEETQVEDVSESASTDSEFVLDPCLEHILESATRPNTVHETSDEVLEWTDKQPGPMKTIQLTHLPQKELLELARKTFQDIHGNISQQTIGSLLVLAYNIMNDEDEHLTAEPCEDLIDTNSTITLQDLSNKTEKKGSGKTVTETHTNLHDQRKDKLMCFAYTYLAASYMRLFTKSAENYLKIEDHLKKKFSSFYCFFDPFPLVNFHPNLNTIKFIRRQFELQDIYKNTFYVFMYASCENTAGKGLKDFLYSIHVSHPGIHPYVLFRQVMESLHTDLETLLRSMYSNGFAVEFGAIIDVFINLVVPKAGNELQMWRFARVLDSKFLSVLKTKNCVLFTLVLAYILKVNDPVRSKGVLEIPQIKGANQSDRIVAYAYALRVLITFTRNGCKGNSIFEQIDLEAIYLK